MHGPTRIFWANLTPASRQGGRRGRVLSRSSARRAPPTVRGSCMAGQPQSPEKLPKKLPTHVVKRAEERAAAVRVDRRLGMPPRDVIGKLVGVHFVVAFARGREGLLAGSSASSSNRTTDPMPGRRSVGRCSSLIFRILDPETTTGFY